MPARYFDDPTQEDRIFGALDRSRQRTAAYAAQADPAVANQISTLQRAYPTLRPGEVLPLGKAGLPVDHPLTTEVVKRSAKRKIKHGFGLHSIGDMVHAGLGAPGLALRESVHLASEVGGDIAGVLRPAARVGFTALATPFEEAAGVLRSTAGAIGGAAGGLVAGGGGGAAVGATLGSIIPGAGTLAGAGIGAAIGGLAGAVGGRDIKGPGKFELQSSGGIALEHLLSGKKVDLGSGFFAGGQVAHEQARRAREVATIRGHALTPGRVIANSIFEPGSEPYSLLSGLTDMAVGLKGDPAVLGLGKLKEARAASKLFGAAGGVDGTRATVIPGVVTTWLNSKSGREVVKAVADERDPVKLWRRLNKKVDLETVRDLAKANDEQAVRDVLAPKLGVEIRQKPTIDTFGVKVKRRLEGVRLAQMLPGGHMDLENLDDVAERMERFGRNAKLPNEQIDKRLNELIINGDDRISRYRAVGDMLDDTAAHLGGGDKVSVGVAKRMTRMFGNYQQELAKYFVDEVGNNVPVLGATINGTDHVLPSPHLFNEYINRSLPIPDARAIRRATASKLGRGIQKIPGAAWTESALDFVFQDVWKPLVLLRGAWTVRVVGEEQVRMGASGLDSVFRHPLSALSYVVGTEKRQLTSSMSRGEKLRAGTVNVLEAPFRRAGIAGRGASGVTGEAFDRGVREFAGALSDKGGGWRDKLYHYGKRIVTRDEDDFAKSWAEELSQLHEDPIASRVAGGWSKGDKVPGGLTGNHVEDAKRWFWDGAGRDFRKQLGSAEGREALLRDRQVADEYIDTVARRVSIKTGDHADLLDMVASGKFRGNLATEFAEAGKNRTVAKGFKEGLSELSEQGIGPQSVKGDIALTIRGSAASEAGQGIDKAVSAMFNTLMSKPTNYLSRSSAFKQFYWRRVEELLPYMTEEAQHAIIHDAGIKAKLGKPVLNRMAKAALSGAGDATLEQADMLAKGHGLEETKKLLYDLSERSQFFDATRLIFPFGEAWKEILATWAKVGVTEGAGLPARRLQQIVQGARGAHIPGTPSGEGFFSKDPTTGEEMFSYPGGQFITEKMFGVPTRLRGRVQGLNLFSTNFVMPGVGPVVQWPAAWAIPDKPEWDEIRKTLIPYGAAGEEKEGILEGKLLPPWLKKLRTAFQGDPNSDRLFANSIMDVARYLATTGKYDTSSEEGINHLLHDAKSKARGLYMIRGFVQFGAPSAPSFEFLAQDPDGRLVTAQALADEYRKLQEADFPTATEKFIDTFGEGAFLYTQTKSRALTFGAPVTKDGVEWARRNPAIRDQFPNTYGLFAPPGGEFDITAYTRQLGAGERQKLTPEQAVQLANDRVAMMIYREAKRKVGDSPTAAQRQVLGQLREALKVKYPGFLDKAGLIDKAEPATIVAELQRASKNRKIAATDAGQGLKLYLQARDAAMAQAQAQGLSSFGTAARARPLRDWLRSVAEAITKSHPDFGDVFDQGLSKEMKQDLEEVGTTLG